MPQGPDPREELCFGNLEAVATAAAICEALLMTHATSLPDEKRAPSSTLSQFLKTGEFNPLFLDWPGQNTLDAIIRGTHALQTALIEELRRREAKVTPPSVRTLKDGGLREFARTKLEPMVRGLFSRKEGDVVRDLLQSSVVFLTKDEMEHQIRRTPLDTAWKLSNIYLGSIGAEPLAHDFPHLAGLSEGATAYISLTYFANEEPFADFVVHEAAHVFHNVKRRTVSLRATRHGEWLLPVAFRMRETFAYACEAYSRITERASGVAERRELLGELKREPAPPDERVSPSEYVDILEDAVERRNGWRTILKRCS